MSDTMAAERRVLLTGAAGEITSAFRRLYWLFATYVAQ